MPNLSNAALEGGATSPRLRVAIIDIARGAAVVAMAVYHFAWDLSELRLIATEVTQAFGWRVFARCIAASFLLLVGVGLALAHRDGIRWRPFLRRFLIVCGASLAVTAVTVAVFPASYIFFGVLHAVAVSSLLAVPFTQAPAAASVLVAALIGAAPFVIGGGVFDAPLLAFLGLGSSPPVTNDWVPLCPWAAFVFAGIAIGKVASPLLRRAVGSPERGFAEALAWAGRHSLVIYLVHQPVLFGMVSGLAYLTGPNPAAVAEPFARSCAASCGETGQPKAVCRATCACTVDGIKGAPLWANVLKSRISRAEEAEINLIARTCFARSRGTE